MYRTHEFKKATPNMRYYFTVVGEMKANVRDRLTHKPIAYLDSFDSINHWIEKLNAMSEAEYYDYIFSLGIRPQDSKDSEEWFLKAWIYETEKILVRLDLEIPDTTQTELTINTLCTEYNTRKKRGTWGDDIKGTNKEKHMEHTKRREEEAEESTGDKPKAPKGKKLLRKTSKKDLEVVGDKKQNTVLAPKETTEKPKEDKATTMQDELDKLTQLKSDSKITFGEYVKMKRQIIEKWGA